jgi:hypothetical protein
VRVLNEVGLNQVPVALEGVPPGADARAIRELSALLNEEFGQFVRPTIWKGRPVLRISIISPATTQTEVEILAEAIGSAWRRVSAVACKDDYTFS